MAKIVILINKQTKFRNYSVPIYCVKRGAEKDYETAEVLNMKGILSMSLTLR